MKKLTKRIVNEAKEQALAALKSHGIDDNFTIKLKSEPFKKKKKKAEWLGMYRSMTQFRGHHIPIFWLNEKLPQFAAEVDEPVAVTTLETILHEYGHVMYEYARVRDSKLFSMMRNISDDEEEFAEMMARVLGCRWKVPPYEEIIKRYVESMSSDQVDAAVA
jgi:hypothetical protein